jgi:hypothetical protein
MLTKSMIAVATAAFAFAALPVERAEAKSDFDINVGIGIGAFVGPGAGHVDVDYDDDFGPSAVSCSEARKVVRWNGFSSVKSLDCTAPSYKFSGWRDGAKYKIKVNSWGDITRISSY